MAIAKRTAMEEWSSDLEHANGQRKMFRLAKQMKADQKDVMGTNFIKDSDGAIKVVESEVVDRWKDYFTVLLNVESDCSLEDMPPVLGPIENITIEEVQQALLLAKNNKSPGPSELCSEMFKYAGDCGRLMLLQTFGQIISSEQITSEWKESLTIPLYKGKGDSLDCGRYRGLRLLDHGFKIFERILLERLKKIVWIHPHQSGFTAGKSTTDAIFILRQLQERYLEKKSKLYHVFVDLEKAFDRVPRVAIRWALRRQLVPEKLVRLVMMLYEDSVSKVRFGGVLSESFEIGVGVHQGSTLSPLLFAVVIEEIAKECRLGDPWELLFADDLVLTSETREGVEEMLRKWFLAFKAHGLTINMSKTKLLVTGKEMVDVLKLGKYPCAVCGKGVGANSILCTGCDRWCHGRCSGLATLARVTDFLCSRCSSGGGLVDIDESLTLEFGTVEEVSSFCYLGDVIDREGTVERSARSRISSGWSKWRELRSLLCNCSIPLKQRAKVYEACVRSAMTYASETWAMTEAVKVMFDSADRRMLRMLCGITLADRISSQNILSSCGLTDLRMIMMRRRLNWFGHVMRRDLDEPLSKIINLEAPGRRPRGRPKKTWRKTLQEDLTRYGVSQEDTLDRDNWRAIVLRLTSAT